MRDRDFIDDLEQSLSSKQPAQQPAQANDLASLFGNYAAGQTPDFGQLMAQYQAVQQPVKAEPRGWEGLLNMISEASLASLAHRLGGGSKKTALGAGIGSMLTGREEKRQNLLKKAQQDREKMFADMLKVAEDQRKYGLEIQKLNQPEYKFSPTGDLVKFEKGAPVGNVDYSGGIISGPVQGGRAAISTSGGNGGTITGGQEASPSVPQAYKSKHPFANTVKGQMMEADREAELNQKRLLEQDKKMGEISKEADAATAQLTNINTLEGLMQKFTSGPISGGIYHEHIGSYFGDKNTAAAKTFQKLATQVFTLATSQAMKGAQSDKDMGLIIGSQVGIDADPRTNQNLFNVYKAQAQRYNQYADAAKQWTNAGGDLEEFNRRWRKYANATPLLSQNEDGEILINENNLTNAGIVFDPNFDNLISFHEGKQEAETPIHQTQKESQRVKEAAPKEKVNPYDFMSLEEKEKLLNQLEKSEG